MRDLERQIWSYKFMCAHINNIYFKLLINHALVINNIHVSKTKNEIVLYKCKSVELDYNLYKAKKLYVFLSDIVNHMQLLWLNFMLFT